MDTEGAVFELIAARAQLENALIAMEHEYGDLGGNFFALQTIANSIDRAAAVIDRDNMGGAFKEKFGDRTRLEVYGA